MQSVVKASEKENVQVILYKCIYHRGSLCGCYEAPEERSPASVDPIPFAFKRQEPLLDCPLYNRDGQLAKMSRKWCGRENEHILIFDCHHAIDPHSPDPHTTSCHLILLANYNCLTNYRLD